MPRIFVLSGPNAGDRFDVKAGATFGRAPECAVTLRDASVSRHHARLELQDGSWTIVDTGSRNGLLLDGRRLERAPLVDGAEFALGEVLLRFRAEEARTIEGARDERPARDARPAPAATAAPADSGEIQLEGDWSAAPSTEAPVRAGPGPARPPPTFDPEATVTRGLARPSAPRAPAAHPIVAPAASVTPPQRPEALQQGPLQKGSLAKAQVARAVASASGAPAAGLATRDRGVLQYHKVENRSGLFAAELSQQPLWLRLAVVTVALALFALVFWLAFRGTAFLKGTPPADPTQEQVEPADR